MVEVAPSGAVAWGLGGLFSKISLKKHAAAIVIKIVFVTLQIAKLCALHNLLNREK